MTVEQALMIVESAASLASLPKVEHIRVEQALNFLKESLKKEKEE